MEDEYNVEQEIETTQPTSDEEGNATHEETVTPENTQTSTNPPRFPVLRELGVVFGILLIVFGAAIVSSLSGLFATHTPAPQVQPAQAREPTVATTSRATTSDPFADLNIQGKAAYVWDVRAQRVLYAKNANEQLPLASVTKLMTALVSYELIGTSTTVSISAAAVDQEGDSGLNVGETFTSQKLTDLTLINSANDGAYALAQAAGAVLTQTGNPEQKFVDAMNVRAEELGLSHTHFYNPTGLDLSKTKSGGYGSAKDVAFLMEYIITKYPQILERTKVSTMHISNELGAAHDAQNTDDVVLDIPGIIASKTGYTDLAGGNLVVSFDAGLNHPIVVAVLGSSVQGRFDDVLKLVHAARTYVSQQ